MTSLRDSILAVLEQARDGDMIVARQPWSPTCESKVVLLGAEEVVIPDAITAEGFSYFLEGDISRDLVQLIPVGALRRDQIVDMLIYYAQNDGVPEWANECIRNSTR